MLFYWADVLILNSYLTLVLKGIADWGLFYFEGVYDLYYLSFDWDYKRVDVFWLDLDDDYELYPISVYPNLYEYLLGANWSDELFY